MKGKKQKYIINFISYSCTGAYIFNIIKLHKTIINYKREFEPKTSQKKI